MYRVKRKMSSLLCHCTELLYIDITGYTSFVWFEHSISFLVKCDSKTCHGACECVLTYIYQLKTPSYQLITPIYQLEFEANI